jgi:spermidine/putrescine transport system permease protein
LKKVLKKMLKNLVSTPYMLWTLIFIIAPLGMVVYYAFTDETGEFTLINISRLGDYADIFIRSIWFALLATLICLVIAYPIAYSVSQRKASAQRTLIMLVMLPMWMNFLLRTYSWMTILEDTGIINTVISTLGLPKLHMINTPGAVILGMVYNYLPYMILPLYSVLTKLDANVIEAAQDLGGNRFNVLYRIIFPLSMPGIVSGITMVFVPSVSTFYISQKLGGGKSDFIGDTIERQFQTAYNYNLGAAISLVLMVLIIICLAVTNIFTDEEDGGMIV